jgi:hypothetical protein
MYAFICLCFSIFFFCDLNTLSAFLYCGVYETQWLGTRHESKYCFAAGHRNLLRKSSEDKLPTPDACKLDICALFFNLEISISFFLAVNLIRVSTGCRGRLGQ